MTVRTEFEKRGEALVARVTLDNPRKLNILGRAAFAQLVEAMRGAERNAQVRAVVLTGAGAKAFVGGANVD